MPEWLMPILVGGVIVGLAGLVWRAHENRDKERFEAIWDQIGRDSKSGMREKVHDTANATHLNGLGLHELERRVERLEDR